MLQGSRSAQANFQISSSLSLSLSLSLSMSLISLESGHELRLSGLLHRLGTVRAVAVRHLARISSARLLLPSTLPWFAWSPHLLIPALSASSSTLVLLPVASIILSVDCLQEHMPPHRPTFLPPHPTAGQLAQNGQVGASSRREETRGRGRGRGQAMAALETCRPKMDGWGSCCAHSQEGQPGRHRSLLHDAAFAGLLHTATVDPDYLVICLTEWPPYSPR